MRDFPRKLRAGDTNGKEAAERREYLDALSTWSRFLSSPFLEVKYVGPDVGFGVYLRMQGRQCQPAAGRQKPQRPHRHPAVVAVEHLQASATTADAYLSAWWPRRWRCERVPVSIAPSPLAG